MIRTTLLLSIFLSGFVICGIGQTNLVINPSFEDTISCPSVSGQIYKAVGWSAFKESPDYFNDCTTNSDIDVPSNLVGYQYASTGNAYAGIRCYTDVFFTREILGDSLMTPLIPDQEYFISFKVTKADDTSTVGYSMNRLGVKLSTVKTSNLTIDNTAHVYTDMVISDAVNWTTVVGSFVADSAYKYLMIGNFFDDENIDLSQSGSLSAYYYIDDVCLSTDSMLCADFTTSSANFATERETLIFPNPASIEISIENPSPYSLAIYNMLGQKVFFKPKSIGEITINTIEWDNGVYIVFINHTRKKIMINH